MAKKVTQSTMDKIIATCIYLDVPVATVAGIWGL